MAYQSKRPAATEYRCEVAVVGGGPVGVTLAHLLGRLGLDTIVFERETGIHVTPRAVGVDDLGLRIWGSCGLPETLWPDMTPLGEGKAGMVFRRRDGRLLVAWRPAQRPYGWPRGVTMVQTQVEARLRSGLRDCPNVRFLPGHEVKSISQTSDDCRLEGHQPEGTFRAASLWVVGCEGGRSVTRRAMGAGMPGRKDTARWLIVDTVETGSGRRSAVDIEVFGAAPRTVVSVPRKGGHRRWEFRLTADAAKEVPSNVRIRKLIEDNGGPPAAEIRRAQIYRFASRRATKYSFGRLALAGDSAHLMPPYAAQGLACGLGDADNLCWRLWLVARHGADSHCLLSGFDVERRAAVRKSQVLTRLSGTIVAPGGLWGQIIRDVIISAALNLPPVRNVLTRGSMRAFSRYGTGTFLRRGPCGHVLPNMKADAGGRLDDHLGNRFALVVNAPEASFADTSYLAFWHALSAKILYISTDGAKERFELSPPPGKWKRWLSLGRLLIIRPDRVVLAYGRVNELERLTRACARVLGLTSL